MPTAPPRFCSAPGCKHLVRRGRCLAHRQDAGANLYMLAAWRHPVWGLRANVLREQPFCAGPGCTRALTRRNAEVDHIQPHHGDRRLFFARRNLQGLCKACHTRKTRAEGRR
jgi:5-methylcytosine-specific restriction protein A